MPKIEFWNPETDETDSLNAIWEICPDCRGDGYSTLHGLAITNDDWEEWDPDERDEYLHGTTYRTPCVNEDCQQGKVLVPDPSMNPPDLLAAYQSAEEAEYDHRREMEMERRMGC